jgi:hypothetical protein
VVFPGESTDASAAGGQVRRCKMFAALDFSDFVGIVVIVGLFSGGRAAWSLYKPSDVARLRRVEAKLDLMLKHLGLEYKDPATASGLSEEVKALADDPAQKIKAIAVHRQQTGLGLKEAKDAVEAYIVGRG